MPAPVNTGVNREAAGAIPMYIGKRSAAMSSRRQHAGARIRRAWAWHPRPDGAHHVRPNADCDPIAEN